VSQPVSDYFAVLAEPRRPWLDPAALKRKFLALSNTNHPDRAHRTGEAERAAATQRYAELNLAYNCLRDPKPRLAHFLHLEFGAKPQELQAIPDDLAELFMVVAGLCREADGLLKEKARMASPLLRVQWFERGQELAQALEVQLNQLATFQEAVMQRLIAADTTWETAQTGSASRTEALRELEEIHRLLGFLTRWMEQIQSRRFQLTL